MRESNSTSNVDTFAIERSHEVEDLLPPESSPSVKTTEVQGQTSLSH